MKAAVLVRNQEIQIKELTPLALEDDECRVRISYAGVCSSDIARSQKSGAYRYPLIMGHEFAGVVEECGRSVKGIQPGDRVTAYPLLPCRKCANCALRLYERCSSYDYYGSRRDGAYAEQLNVKAWNLLKLPEGISLSEAALSEPVAVVMHCLRRIGIKTLRPKSRVAVIGAGFLGQITIELLRRSLPDSELVLIDRNAFKLDQAAPGVLQVLLRSPSEWEDFAKAADASFDCVIESCGAPQTFEESLRLANRGGIVAWMGNIDNDLILKKELVSQVLRKELSILGTWNSTYQPFAETDDWREALKAMQDGLDVMRFVSRKMNLFELGPALNELASHKAGTVKASWIKLMVEL